MQITINRFDSSKEYRAGLDRLLRKSFGLSLAPWFRAGGWTKDYACYSIIDGGQVIANVSLYRMDLLVNGQEEVWLQVGGVAVAEEHRGKGVGGRLLEFALDRHADTPAFLCANETTLDFYPRFGFQRFASQALRLTDDRQVRQIGSAPVQMNRLDVHDPRVMGLLEARTQFSAVLDCTNDAPIGLFHLLGAYRNCIYEIPSLQALVVARQEGSRLELAGVFTAQPLTFAALAPALNFRGVHQVDFGFNPDWLGLSLAPSARPDDALFVRGADGLPGLLPELIRT